MKKDMYVYPSILTYEKNGISIEFPDLVGCLPCATNTEEAIKNSKEAMALHLYGMEESNIEIPTPTSISDIKLEQHQTLLLVEVYMPLYRDAIENSFVSKNVTLPLWLRKVAEENKINFSQLLQSALKEKLNIKK
jgi:predicted RNase H-like HicB family nuclease